MEGEPAKTEHPHKSGIFGERSVRIWSVFAGLATIVGLVIAAVQLWPSSTRLAVERFAVQDPTSVDAELTDISGGPSSEESIESNTIDITLRNDGDDAAFISQAKFTLLYAQQMEDCQRMGGEVQASANYTVKVPTDLPQLPYAVTKDLSYEVAGRDVDRLTFTMGPEEQSLSSSIPWVYVAEVALRYDDSKTITVGTAAMLARPEEGMEHLKTGLQTGDWECLEHNQAVIDAAYEFEASRSTELEALKLAFTDALQTDQSADTPAKEACAQGDGQGLYVAQVCYAYTRRELKARFFLSEEPVAQQTFLVMRITQSDSGTPLRWVAKNFEDQWGIGFIYEDDRAVKLDGNGCGPCTSFGIGRQVEFTIPTGTELGSTQLSIVTEVYDVSDPASPNLIYSLEGGRALKVTRSG